MPTPEPQSVRHRVETYLCEELAASDGRVYLKSRHIAGALDLSVKRIGVAMATLEGDPDTPFVLSRRGGSSDGTTWCLTPADS